jgi:hypothetical protein
MIEKLANQYRAELEPPDAQGFRIFLGRTLPNPDHRASALEFALKLREALDPLLRAQDFPLMAAGVVTAEAVTAPFPSSAGSGVRSFGKAMEQVILLRERAEAGEILVDQESAVPDAGFSFQKKGDRRRLLGLAEEEEAL